MPEERVRACMRLGRTFSPRISRRCPFRRTQPPPRIQIQAVEPHRRLRPVPGQATSATASTCTRPCSRTVTTRSAGAVRVRGPGRARLAEEPLRALDNDRWAGRSRSTGRAGGSSPSRRGPTASRPGRTSCGARSRPARRISRGELAEGAALLGARVADGRGRARRGGRRPPRRGRLGRRSRWTSIACSRGSAPGTSCSRARGAGSRRDGGAAAAGGARFRRRLPAADPPDRAHEPEGTNNTLDARAGDPGSPVGDRRGGGRPRRDQPGARHVGGLRRDGRRGARRGVEIALDFAIQCSPDHPWLKEHPEWFNRRPDGTLKYAENPPKRYQDIYNVNFESEDWRGLWQALLEVVLYWVERGVHGVPRRQPAHEAGRVLGVADPRGARRASGGDLPRRRSRGRR